ncbi:tetratricopeptide repeat protein [bacterium]|nr:tetratricopeptide repeat protein [bacterium]
MNKTFLQTKIDELLNQLESAEENTDKVDILSRLSGALRNSDPKKAMQYAEEGLELAETLGFEKGIAECLNNIGIIHREQGDYSSALENYQKSLEIYMQLDNEQGISNCMASIGIIYWNQGNYSQALKYLYKALESKENLGDKPGISKCFNNIGNIYWFQNNYSQALEYYHKSLKMKKELGDKEGISTSLNNIGVIYGIQGDYPHALEYFIKSLKIYEELNDKDGVSTVFMNIGEFYYYQNDFNRSLEYYNKSLKIFEELNNKNGIANSLINIGSVFVKTQKSQKAIKYLMKALNIVKEIGAMKMEMENYGVLSEAYAKSRKYKKALEYYKLYKETNDKLFNEEKSKQITNMRVKYETEQKEKEAEIYKLRNVELAQANEKIDKAHKELAEAYRQLEIVSRTDPLTLLLNRRGFLEQVTHEIHRYERSGKAFSIIIADIDDFKSFNDSFGHDCGDFILTNLSQIIRKTLRKQDSVGRWGGDEFILLLPETPIDGAIVVAEKIRKKVAKLSISYKDKNLSVTMSFGAAVIEKSLSIDECIKKADESLYQAKESGKNMVMPKL